MSASHAGGLAVFSRLRPHVSPAVAVRDCSWSRECNANNATRDSATRGALWHRFDGILSWVLADACGSKGGTAPPNGRAGLRGPSRSGDRRRRHRLIRSLRATPDWASNAHEDARSWLAGALDLLLNQPANMRSNRYQSSVYSIYHSVLHYLNQYLTIYLTSYLCAYHVTRRAAQRIKGTWVYGHQNRCPSISGDCIAGRQTYREGSPSLGVRATCGQTVIEVSFPAVFNIDIPIVALASLDARTHAFAVIVLGASRPMVDHL